MLVLVGSCLMEGSYFDGQFVVWLFFSGLAEDRRVYVKGFLSRYIVVDQFRVQESCDESFRYYFCRGFYNFINVYSMKVLFLVRVLVYLFSEESKFRGRDYFVFGDVVEVKEETKSRVFVGFWDVFQMFWLQLGRKRKKKYMNFFERLKS